jgi:hypothetical protein
MAGREPRSTNHGEMVHSIDIQVYCSGGTPNLNPKAHTADILEVLSIPAGSPSGLKDEAAAVELQS